MIHRWMDGGKSTFIKEQAGARCIMEARIDEWMIDEWMNDGKMNG